MSKLSMGDYLDFVNKNSVKFKFDIDYNEYVSVRSYISRVLQELLSYRGVKIEDTEPMIDFEMCYILKHIKVEDILKNGCEDKIEELTIALYNYRYKDLPKNKRITFPEKDEAVDYIYNDLKEMRFIFDKDQDIGFISKCIKDSLVFDGFKEDDILKGNADQKIIEYIAQGFFDIKFSKEFTNIKNAISPYVAGIFNTRKKEAGFYKINQDNFEYVYFDTYANLRNAIFCISVAFTEHGVNPTKFNYSSPEMKIIYDYIQRDMIRVNSTRVNIKPDTEIEKWNKLSRDVQEERMEDARKIAIVMAIIFGLMCVENMIYNSIHKDKGTKERTKYKVESTSYDINRATINIGNGKYNTTDNTLEIYESEGVSRGR